MNTGANTSGRALDGLNFFLADVRDGLGPYLAIYLLTVQHWDAAGIGLVMSVAGIAGLVAQTPAGVLVDSTTAKRGLLIAAALAVTAASLAMPLVPQFWPVTGLQIVTGAAAAVFAPAICAITLGLFGPRAFAQRVGRNEAFNHAGNAAAALCAGGAAMFYGPIAVFWLMAGMAVASVLAALAIPAGRIDHALARGAAEKGAGAATPDDGRPPPSAWSVLLTCRPLLVFSACVALFHFANAAMLPLVGQKLALQDRNQGTALMSVCVVGAQMVMIPMAALVGRRADRWGRKPLLIAAFAILPLRGFLYTLSDAPYWLLGVQLLDGVGAGLLGALFPIVVADLTRGSGHFNAAQGAVATAQGIGASLSNAVAGAIVVAAGYSAAFLALGATALAALALLILLLPESHRMEAEEPDDTGGLGAPCSAAAQP